MAPDGEKLGGTAIAQGFTAAGFVALVAVMTAGGWYGYTRVMSLSREVSVLRSELASTTALLQGNLTEATASIGDALQQERQNIQAQLGGVRDQVGKVSGTVNDLQKLSATDPELLAKYSKVFFLSENYAPERLVEVPSEYKYNEKNPIQVIPQTLPHFSDLFAAAKNDSIDLYLSSAYRSFDTQTALKGQYRVTYGAGTANVFSADQGYSEHQLGTAVDFITTGTGGALNGFDTRPAYPWMLENAYRYGFVLSYPKNNGYYIFEPWHWRFVGVKLATDLHKSGKNFYDLDQRTIDTYLISLFD